MLSLFFNGQRELMGEIMTEKGALNHIQLTPPGEKEIGAHCERWQTQGIPVRREVISEKSDGSKNIAFFLDRILARKPEFFSALERWASDRHYFLLSLPTTYIPYWERLFVLPLSAQERFAFLLALRQTPEHLLSEWKDCLRETEISAGASADIKQKMATHLRRPFKARAS